jgi:hypothetical protein
VRSCVGSASCSTHHSLQSAQRATMKLCVAFHFVVHEIAKPLIATFLLYMRFWLFHLNLSNGEPTGTSRARCWWSGADQNKKPTTQQMNSVSHYEINAWYITLRKSTLWPELSVNSEASTSFTASYYMVGGNQPGHRNVPLNHLFYRTTNSYTRAYSYPWSKSSDVEEMGRQHNFLARHRDYWKKLVSIRYTAWNTTLEKSSLQVGFNVIFLLLLLLY